MDSQPKKPVSGKAIAKWYTVYELRNPKLTPEDIYMKLVADEVTTQKSLDKFLATKK